MKISTNYFAFIFFLLLSVTAKAAGHTVTITVNQQAGCVGETNGEAIATVADGTGPFTYLWDDAASSTSALLSNAGAGSYTVTVTDESDGSMATATCTITESEPIVPLFDPIPPFCQNTGSFPLPATSQNGIVGTWNPASVSTNNVIGSYNFTFTPAAGTCATTTTKLIQVLNAPNISVPPVSTCADYPVALHANGGFNYSWSPSTGLDTTAGANVTATVSTATTYTITATGTNGCQGSTTTTVNLNGLMITVPPYVYTCPGGSSQITASGATTYAWTPTTGVDNPNAASVIVSPTSTTTYTVTGEIDGCSGSKTVLVTLLPQMVVSLTPTPTCGSGCTGALAVSITGATGGPIGYEGGGGGGYTYMWTSGGGGLNWMSLNQSNLCAGVYSLMVTSADGCTGMGSAEVLSVPGFTIEFDSVEPTTCVSNDGSANCTVDGGTAPFTYSWTGPNGFSSNLESVSGLGMGDYSLVVTDANGCSQTTTFNLGDDFLDVQIDGVSSICGGGTGSAVANVSGATGDITYHWMPGNMSGQSVSGLNSATYTVTVEDEAGCIESESVVIHNTSSPTLNTSITDAGCGQSNGHIYATATGGTSPYSYSFNGGTYTSTHNWSGLANGTYTIQVRDVNLCTGSTTATVGNGSGLNASTSVTPSSCTNSANGAINLSVYNGTAPYTFLWSNGATTQNISGLNAGVYTCVVHDNSGCETTVSAQVSHSAPFYLIPVNTFSNCGTGDINVPIYNPSGVGEPFSFLWSNGTSSQTLTDATPGNYTVTVANSFGCEATGSYTVYDYNYSLIKGKVVIDRNEDCVIDENDDFVFATVEATSSSGSQFYGVTDNNGDYEIRVPNNAENYSMDFALSGYYNSPYYTLDCSVPNAATGANCDTLAGIDFPITAMPAQDLMVELWCGAARPGFEQGIFLTYANPGTIEMDGVVAYDLDPLLTFSNATPAPDLVLGNHLEWNFSDLHPSESGQITVWATVPTIENGGELGTEVIGHASIEPLSGDLAPENNESTCSREISGSFDPNMKEVYSPQAHSSGAIDSAGANLYYTVHFQNTGTDTAFTIVVRDTLSPFVDIMSLQMLSSSHHYTWSIQPGRCLEVRFDQILLVDSNKNEPLSHGFFNYHIRSNDHLPLGAQIDNTAGIYFDFNEPVITNTVSSPIVAFANVDEKPEMEAIVYPNPNNTGSVRVKLNGMSYNEIQFQLTDANGRVVRANEFTNSPLFDIDLTGLQNGIYFYTITNEQGNQSTGKLMIVK